MAYSNYRTLRIVYSLVVSLVVVTMSQIGHAQQSDPHTVRTTKFTIKDVEESTLFYEDLIGMTEIDRFEADSGLVEPFMAFSDDGKRIGLLRFDEYEDIQKSKHPVSVVVVPIDIL